MMSNTAYAREDEEPRTHRRTDLERVAAVLVQLEAWCRQRGMNELAEKMEAAVDLADGELTRG